MIRTIHLPRRLASLTLVAAFALSLAGISARPARADGAASTRNIILGVAAAIAADVIINNIHHKAVAHDTIVGHTSDGGTIYADGRVAYPNGDVLYTGNAGRPCSYLGYGTACGARPVVYYPQGYRGHDHGNHYGWYKHDRDDRPWKHDKHGDRDDRHGDRDDRDR